MSDLPIKKDNQGEEFRQFLNSLVTYLKLESVEKLARVFSSLLWLFVFILLLFLIVLFLTKAAVAYLAVYLGGQQWASLAVALFFVLVMLVMFLLKRSLILNPLIRALVKIFFDEGRNGEKGEKE